MTKWEEPHATSSTNSTVLCCVLPWHHLLSTSCPCCWICVLLQTGELFLFYTMEQEGDKAENQQVVLLCHPSTSFPGQFCPKQPVLLTQLSSTRMICSSLHLPDFPIPCWGQTVQPIFPAGSPRPKAVNWHLATFSNLVTLLCDIPPYLPSLKHQVSSGSSSLAFFPLLHPHTSKRNFSSSMKGELSLCMLHYTAR